MGRGVGGGRGRRGRMVVLQEDYQCYLHYLGKKSSGRGISGGKPFLFLICLIFSIVN